MIRAFKGILLIELSFFHWMNGFGKPFALHGNSTFLLA
jgi:hypothetical protein